MKKLCGLAAIIACLLFSPLPVAAEIMDRVVASIGDDAITAFDVEKEGGALFRQIAATAAADERDERLAEARKKVLDSLIEKVLLLREAKRIDISVSDDEVDSAVEKVKTENKLTQEALLTALAREGITFDRYREEVRAQIVRSKVIDKRVRAVIDVSDEDILIYYERNRDEFSTDEEIRARHILFLVPREAGEERRLAIENRAAEVLALVRAGGDFAELARTYSEGPSAPEGGELGFFRREDMVKAFSRAAFALEKGEISNLVLSPFGYHIIEVLDKRGGTALPFEEISQKIKARLYGEELNREIKAFIEQLKEEENVRIHL